MGNQQEVYGVSRSWFYLTLWHGTPEEFTTFYDVEIADIDFAHANISTQSKTMVDIEKTTIVTADVQKVEDADVDVITKTEVIWLVN